MDSMQRVYISEERGLVYKFTLSGGFLQMFEIPGAKKLASLIVMENGSIVVTDQVRNCLWIVDKNGERTRRIGEQFLLGPCSISLGTNNYYVVVNKTAHTVTFIDTETEEVRATLGGVGSDHGQFKSPEGACLTSDSSLVIADTGNHRLQLFTAAGIYPNP